MYRLAASQDDLSRVRRRRTSQIDLFVAYLQCLLGGDIPIFLMMDRRLFELMEDGHLWRELRNPVAQLRKALYGITRAGYDFTGDFQAWLIVNLFIPSLNEPGLLNLWHREDNAAMINRAVNLKEYLKGMVRGTPVMVPPSLSSLLRSGTG